jgi:hypothetical protein
MELINFLPQRHNLVALTVQKDIIPVIINVYNVILIV